MRFAEEQTEKSVKVIDARKRVISIVKPGELAVSRKCLETEIFSELI